jgi:hypothetical protein
MKRIFYLYLLPIAFIIAIFACNNKKTETDNKNKKILAERIQYDVMIKSPDPDYDWWRENIEGSKRETFVRTILDLAYSGKVKAYDYFNNPLTPEEVKKIGNRVDTVYYPDPVQPNKIIDTVFKTTLNIQEITKVRFLEEWYLDEKSYSFDKKVVGLMLMMPSYGDSSEIRGYMPICWLYFDDKYPAKMK